MKWFAVGCTVEEHMVVGKVHFPEVVHSTKTHQSGSVWVWGDKASRSVYDVSKYGA